jgi:addiction module HigA family antidote
MNKKTNRLPAIHPGEILREDFMKPLKLSANRLAIDLRIPVTRISEIVHERRGITADTALRLGRYFDMNAQFWLNLQMLFELEVAEREGITAQINRNVHQRQSESANA